MPDDVGGRPFPDGWEPDDDRGGADEDFASVVFDESFVKAATIHEPTAVERLLEAAQARAEADAARMRGRGRAPEDDLFEELYGPGGGPDGSYDDDDLDDTDEFSPYGRGRGSLRPARWHRPVAWILALVMGIGMVALAFTAVYRGASNGRQDRVPPPATTGIDKPHPTGPSASAEYSAPGVSAVPKTP